MVDAALQEQHVLSCAFFVLWYWFHGALVVQSRHLNGFPDMPPVRPNFSYGDSLAGLHAAFGTVMALLHRQRKSPAPHSHHTSHGQVSA